MNLTMEQLKNMESIIEEIKNRCIEIMIWKNFNCNEDYYTQGEISCIDFDRNHVELTVEESWAYGGHETHYYSFTFEEIINDDWQAAYLERYMKLCKEKELQKEMELQQRKKEKEERELAEYERLKAKYEN